MSEILGINKPEISKPIVRAWLYKLLAELELCENVEGEYSVGAPDTRWIELRFKF